MKAIENQDFYIKNGMVIFTASFLLRRGFCCNNGCLNCPYNKQKEKTKEKA